MRKTQFPRIRYGLVRLFANIAAVFCPVDSTEVYFPLLDAADAAKAAALSEAEEGQGNG